MRRLYRLALLSLLLSPLAACALSGGPLDGRVLEAGTNKPISGAIVVVRWTGSLFAFVESQTKCVHVETATTDNQGKYRIPAWMKVSTIGWVQDLRPDVTAYKPGYMRSPEYFKQQSYRKNIELLEAFKGTSGERLKYLERLEEPIRICQSPEAGEKNLLPFYRALHAEGSGIAKTQNEWKIVDGFLTDIDIIELGYKEGLKRGIERAEKRRQQP